MRLTSPWSCELLATVTVKVVFADPSMLTLPDASPSRVIVLAVDHFAALPVMFEEVKATVPDVFGNVYTRLEDSVARNSP